MRQPGRAGPLLEWPHRIHGAAFVPTELFRNEHHACLMFTDLVEDDGQAVQAIEDFYAWIENLRCGIDLFDERNYQMPAALIDPRGNRSNPLLRVA